MFKVACLRPRTDFSDYDVEIPREVEAGFFTNYEEEAICAACKEADAILAPSPFPQITGKTIRGGRNLKIIQLTGAGYNTVDLEAAREKGVIVACVPGGNARAVAEYSFTMMGMLMRHFPAAALEMSNGADFSRLRQILVSGRPCEYKGKVLGIYGVGRIGLELAGIAHYFGMEIIYHDLITLPPELEKQCGASRVEFDELLELADVLSIHVPLNKFTEGIIGWDELKKMKRTAILINAGRGGIVDEEALCRGIEENIIAGAAVDSFVRELLPFDHPLRSVSRKSKGRLILTPHIAGTTVQSFQKMFAESWANVLRVKNGEKPVNIVL